MIAGLLRRLRGAGQPDPAVGADEQTARFGAPRVGLRSYYDQTDTHRLNEARYTGMSRAPVNLGLQSVTLRELRFRARHEARHSAIVEGVIDTYANAAVGSHGPARRCRSNSDPETAKQIETAWRSWWRMPDAARKLTGVDLCRLWFRSPWTEGETLTQLVTGPADSAGVTLRVHTIDPERLREEEYRDNVVLGVEIDKYGGPLAYYIDDTPVAQRGMSAEVIARVGAESILHDFETHESGQVRGIPLLAPALEVVGELRDLDTSVLDAMRMAADESYSIESDSPDVRGYTPKPSELFTCEEMERRAAKLMPPGWHVKHHKPEQPGQNHVPYRHDRLREIGRAKSIPLMLTLLDASNHNYSSARFDKLLFERSISGVQQRCEAHVLDRIFEAWLSEWSLANRVVVPEDLACRWHWPPMPHVDRGKEVAASVAAVAAGVSSRTQEALVCSGLEFEDLADDEVRENEIRASRGLPPLTPPGVTVVVSPGSTGNDDQDDDQDDDDESTDDTGDNDRSLVITERRSA